MNEIVVIITDTNGHQFKKQWSGTADKLDAIKWTLGYEEDFKYNLNVNEIIKIEIKEACK